MTSYNRMVLLTGEVAERGRQDHGRAGRGAGRQRAVGRQRADDRRRRTRFGERSKDGLLTTKVKASLVDAKDLFANSFKVVTDRGIVYLMGRVTEREATRAAEVARGVGGVQKVVRVFEVVSEAELASTAPRSVASARQRA